MMQSDSRRAKAPLAIMTLAMACLLIVALTLPFWAAGPETPDFSGTWKLNKKESDNPREKLREAMPKGGPGLARGGVEIGGRPMGDPRMGPPPGAEGPRGGPGMLEPPERLEIEQDETKLSITDSRQVTRTFHTDGRKESVENERGDKIETSARWEDADLVIETRMPRGGKMVQTYQMAKGGGQLVIITKLENERASEPIVLRSVYDFVEKE